MRIKPAIATICAAALVCAASSASAWQAQSNTVAKEKKAAQKKKCRWIEQTGTNRSERICLTAEEWRQVNEYLEKQAY